MLFLEVLSAEFLRRKLLGKSMAFLAFQVVQNSETC